MKIETAIELLEHCKRDDFTGYGEEGKDIHNDIKVAHDLGIEALKSIRDMRQAIGLPYYTPLPGETPSEKGGA